MYLEENTAWTLPDVDYTPYQNILSAVWPSLRHKSYNWGVLKVDVNNADTFYKDFTELSVMDPCSHPETIKCGITGNTNCTLFTVKYVTDIQNLFLLLFFITMRVSLLLVLFYFS